MLISYLQDYQIGAYYELSLLLLSYVVYQFTPTS